MEKYVLTINGEKEVFDSFEYALKVFLETIYDYVHLTKYVFEESSLPEDYGYFLDYKFEHNQSCELERDLYSKLTQLFEIFNICDPNKSKEISNRLVPNDIFYHGENDEFEEVFFLKITKKPDEIILNIEADIVFETYIKTNAFIFDNKQKTYYYKAHQVINGTPVKEDAGKPVVLDISLQPLNGNNIS